MTLKSAFWINTKAWIKNHKFLQDIIVLMSGTVGAQVLSFLLIPVITRIYSPDNFGIMTTFSTLSTILIVLTCGRYEQAIVLPQDDNEGWAVAVLSFIICISFTFVCFFIILIFKSQILEKIFDVTTFPWIWTIPIVVFFGGLRLILNYWQTRKKRFKTLSVSKVGETAGNQGTKLALGFLFGNKAGNLIIGIIGYSLAPVILLLWEVLKFDLKTIKFIPSWDKLRSVKRKYKDFFLYSSWSALLNELARSLPVFFLALIYDNAVVGAFGLANNTLRIPVMLIGNSVRQVYLQRTSELIANHKKIALHYLKATIGLFAASCPPFLILALFGQKLFSVIFGENWHVAGLYAQILSPWLLTMCVNPTSTILFIVLQKQRFYMFYIFIVTATRAAVFLYGMHYQLVVAKILIYLSVSSAVLNLYAIVFGYKLALNHDKSLNLKTT